VDDQTRPIDTWDGIIADLAYALVAIAAPDDDIRRMLTNAGYALLDKPIVPEWPRRRPARPATTGPA